MRIGAGNPRLFTPFVHRPLSPPDIIGDIVVGILGAFIGGWLLPRLNIELGSGLLAEILNAAIGAILLLVIKLLRCGGRSWGR